MLMKTNQLQTAVCCLPGLLCGVLVQMGLLDYTVKEKQALGKAIHNLYM